MMVSSYIPAVRRTRAASRHGGRALDAGRRDELGEGAPRGPTPYIIRIEQDVETFLCALSGKRG